MNNFEEACYYDKLGIVPEEKESLDEFITRSYLTLKYSKYHEIEEMRNCPKVPDELFFDAVYEMINLIDMNLCWVDARYKDTGQYAGLCGGKIIIYNETTIYVPNIFVHKKYSNSKSRERCKSILRHELIHAGKDSFNYHEIKDDMICRKVEDYIAKWLGNCYGDDEYTVDEFMEKRLKLENPQYSDIYPKLKFVESCQKKLRKKFGKKKSLYIISRLLDSERELIAKEDVKFLVRYKPGLKWDIIRKKVFG